MVWIHHIFEELVSILLRCESLVLNVHIYNAINIEESVELKAKPLHMGGFRECEEYVHEI